MKNATLVGTWRLLSMEHISNKGGIFLPFGDAPVGQLNYTGAGFMSVHIMAKNRPLLKTTNVFHGAPEEKLRAAESYLGYSGTYVFDDKKVFHHVTIASFPNWVGTTQERFVKLENDILELSTAPFMSQGARETAYLTWQKI